MKTRLELPEWCLLNDENDEGWCYKYHKWVLSEDCTERQSCPYLGREFPSTPSQEGVERRLK